MGFNRFYWDLYRKSAEGIAVCNSFLPENRDIEDDVRLFNVYNTGWKLSKAAQGYFADFMDEIWGYGVSEHEEGSITSMEEAKEAYNNLIEMDFLQGFVVDSLIPALSLPLSYRFGEFFFPYLFTNRYFDLLKIADYFNIDIPEPPKKSAYKERILFYFEICKSLYEFRTKNKLTPDELCAFLYDYAPRVIAKELPLEIPEPSQAWFIGGLIPKAAHCDGGFWQANPETKKGDILIHYETTPVSAITALWIAQTDGVIDPFIHYYSNTYIGNRIDIPHITRDELRADHYFKNHPLVRKNFQGCNGWLMTSGDYEELLRIIKSKGADTKLLPRLYAPTIHQNANIKHERDVEVLLLEPLLNSMGLYEGEQFVRQLPIHAGRGHRVFPDYALHYSTKPDEESAEIIIEAKLCMRNNQERDAAFLQARSYAMILGCSTIVLCDKECLMVYRKSQNFDRDKYIKYYWKDMQTPEKFNNLKEILCRKQD